MGRAIFHKSAPNLMILLQSLRMRATAAAVAQAVRTQRKVSAARSSSARNQTVGRKTARLLWAPCPHLTPMWISRLRLPVPVPPVPTPITIDAW
jgi:hypothetical protein